MKTINRRALLTLLAASALSSMSAVPPPFAEDFTTSEGFEAFTVIDANEDEETWYHTKKLVRITYNDDIGMDDWLITPGLDLAADKIYPLKFSVNGRSNSAKYVERIEVWLGTSPTVEGMTVAVLPAYEFSGKEVVELSAMIPATADGVYYIGFHCCSAPGMYGLDLDDIEIGEGKSGGVPAQVGAFTVTPDPMGNRTVEVAFDAPAVNAVGKDLASLDKVEILRDGAVIETLTDVTPGRHVALTFDSPGGYHTFSAVAANADGASQPVSREVFVGVNRAPAPASVTIKATENLGEVALTWDEVAEDIDGTPINPALVRYRIYDNYNKTVVVDDLEGTSYTFTPVEPGSQAIVYYDIYTVTDGGVSQDAARSKAIPVGTPYTLPFRMSFTESDLDKYQMAQDPKGGVWQLSFDDETVQSQDGDNAMMGLFGYNSGDGGDLFTGLIHMADIPNPTLTVHCYHMALAQGGTAVPNETEFTLMLKEGDTLHELSAFKASELPSFGWNRVSAEVPASLLGKDVQIYVRVIAANCPWTFIDNISLASTFDQDLSAEISSIPQSVAPGAEFTITGKVVNRGLKSAGSDYTVTLLRDGEPLATRPGMPLQPGENGIFLFDTSLNVASPQSTGYALKVDYPLDGNTDDNLSETSLVSLDIPDYPVATSLSARSEDGAVIIDWQAPVYDLPLPQEITDDLESYPSFATEGAGEWSFIDRDQSPIGFINKLTFPGIEPYSLQSYWVCDDTQLNSTAEAYKAHCGNKYFAAMYRADDKAADDWLISPLLCGEAQTIRFYASSVDSRYSESFEVLYSTGSLLPEDFVKAGAEDKIEKGWKEYTFDIPEGALRFAIRSVGESSTLLKIDDITYTPAVPDLTLTGYNLYRDGERINTDPVTATTYTDNDVANGRHTYGVSAVYKAGESPLSETVEIDHASSGIDTAEATGIKVTASDGVLLITGAEGLTLTLATPDGRSTTLLITSPAARIPLPPGLYIVKVGHHIGKHRL